MDVNILDGRNPYQKSNPFFNGSINFLIVSPGGQTDNNVSTIRRLSGTAAAI